MKNLDVLVLYPFEEKFRVLNWKVTKVDSVEQALEKIRTSEFRVFAIHDSIEKMEKLKLKKLAQLLVESLVIVEFSAVEELENTVRSTYWNQKETSSTIKIHDNPLGFDLSK